MSSHMVSELTPQPPLLTREGVDASSPKNIWT